MRPDNIWDMPALSALLDQLCPMHLHVSETGFIEHSGPTLEKLFEGRSLVGTRFLEEFELQRPRSISTIRDLLDSSQSKLHLQMRSPPQTSLKAALVRLPDKHGAIINLSFGISVVDAVQHFDLSNADFAPTDLTIEMLYLVEAKSAAMDASRRLNKRLEGAKVAAELQARTDTLTGLKNRRSADHLVTSLIGARQPFALMHLDLDFFKKVNDSFGHAAGDVVLQKAAEVMQRETRDTDMVARTGGDEFMIVFDGLTNPERLKQIAQRLITGIEAPITFKTHSCHVSASIGICVYQGQSHIGAEKLIQRTDQALYASKRKGRAAATYMKLEETEPASLLQSEYDGGPM